MASTHTTGNLGHMNTTPDITRSPLLFVIIGVIIAASISAFLFLNGF